MTLADASTSTSTQCVAREATMTDVTGNYLEALDQECLRETCKSVGTQSHWSQSVFEHDDNKVKFYSSSSCVRIHIERVIGLLLQRHTILLSTLPINMTMCPEHSDISKIVTVCCALCNACESVVPFD